MSYRLLKPAMRGASRMTDTFCVNSRGIVLNAKMQRALGISPRSHVALFVNDDGFLCFMPAKEGDEGARPLSKMGKLPLGREGGGRMNKKELIKSVSIATGLSERKCLKALDATTRLIQACVARGESVKIYNFGAFERKIRKARRFVNKRGVTDMPATPEVRFRAATQFKQMIKGK